MLDEDEEPLDDVLPEDELLADELLGEPEEDESPEELLELEDEVVLVDDFESRESVR